MPNPTATAKGTGTPCTIMEVDMTAENAATDPTERSIPPEMITSVMPSAMQALMVDC